MKKVLLLPAFLLLFVLPTYSISFRIALSDFAVYSDNPKYKYMGKGISEMIAVELGKSTYIDLIERERRAEVLEEIEFALSDLADTTKQVEVGKMLVAKYLVFGEIVDMDKEVLISLRMIDVESTKVVWTEKVIAKISNYDYITGYFTQSILKHLDLAVDESTVAKVEAKAEKNEAAVVAFSTAIDHYDKKEMVEAKQQLTIARRVDPKNEAVQIYLDKLLINLSKFRIETPSHISNQNPAYLGILQYDQLFFLFTIAGPNYTPLELSNFKYRDQHHVILLGYSIPLGQKMGVQFSGFYVLDGDDLIDEPSLQGNEATSDDYGAQVNFGWAISDFFAVGLGLSVFQQDLLLGRADPLPEVSGVQEPLLSAWTFGFLIKNPQTTVIFDILSGYSQGRTYLLHAEYLRTYLDFGTPYELGDSIAMPIFLEGTLTFAFKDRRIFLVLKQSNDIYLDQPYYTGRIIPAAELWVSERFSLRGGLDVSLHKLEDTVEYGFGGIGGFTIRSPNRKWDLDINASYRMYPLRSLSGEVLYQLVGYLSFSRNMLFKSR